MPADGADLTTLSLQAELTHDGRCTLTFLNPAALTCITMIGTAERLPPVWKPAAQGLRPIRPLARPASARSSSGRPPASASLGQLADMFWLAGHIGRAFSHRLPSAEEETLHDTWPLFPPLPLLYPGEARQNFSGLGLG